MKKKCDKVLCILMGFSILSYIVLELFVLFNGTDGDIGTTVYSFFMLLMDVLSQIILFSFILGIYLQKKTLKRLYVYFTIDTLYYSIVTIVSIVRYIVEYDIDSDILMFYFDDFIRIILCILCTIGCFNGFKTKKSRIVFIIHSVLFGIYYIGILLSDIRFIRYFSMSDIGIDILILLMFIIRFIFIYKNIFLKVSSSSKKDTPEYKLKNLLKKYEQGEISEEEYQSSRAEIIQSI